jgi:hypothetical protein
VSRDKILQEALKGLEIVNFEVCGTVTSVVVFYAGREGRVLLR